MLFRSRGLIESAEIEALSEKDLSKRIKLLEKQMLDHARNLEFEKAARVRDQLALLREQAFGAAGHDSNVLPLVAGLPAPSAQSAPSAPAKPPVPVPAGLARR